MMERLDNQRLQECSDEVHRVLGGIIKKISADGGYSLEHTYDVVAFICLNHACAAAVLSNTSKEHFIKYAGITFDEQVESITKQAEEMMLSPKAWQ